MDATPRTFGADIDASVASIAAAIGEPARTRMLYSLLDGHARTGTELAIVADVSPSTASVHLSRLKSENLVRVFVQGRHRYYSLAGPDVARALERLSVLAGGTRPRFVPHTPEHLRTARSCYDHMAGSVAVSLHDHFVRSRWIEPLRRGARKQTRIAPRTSAYDLTADGTRFFAALGLNLGQARASRRRFAYACLDWSERRPHLGGALGAALLSLALSQKWLAREYDSRALTLTRLGRREFHSRFGLEL
ncbi:MAG TPA: helix-turn-helix transcriptional regulator [Acidobacteriaceae bacterium]|nr:helix-turn-helix transcriptional regulator [Acidobacteriaceae bacterium]